MSLLLPLKLVASGSSVRLCGSNLLVKCKHFKHKPSFTQSNIKFMRNQHCFSCISESSSSAETEDGLLPEEDEEIPGTMSDALNPNTTLGKAIKSACQEVELLNNLELAALKDCDALLKKLGVTKSLFDVPEIASDQNEEEEEVSP